MRVLHVTPYFEPAFTKGGVATAAGRLAHWQAKAGLDVTVFTTEAGVPESARVRTPENRDGVEVFYFPLRAKFLYLSVDLLASLQRRVTEFDILHFHGLWTIPGTMGAFIVKRSGIPYVVTPHGTLSRWSMRYRLYKKRTYWWLFERWAVLGSQCVHFTTDREADEAQRWIGDHRVAVVPLPVELPDPPDPVAVGRWREAAGIPARVPLLGFLGRIHPKKGIDLLIEALPAIPKVHLVVAGPDEFGMRVRLMAQAAQAGVAPRIHWLGTLDSTGRDAMLGAIDVMVYPSKDENFGLSVAEAMAAGVPVVTTPGVALAPLIHRWGAGSVVRRDPMALAQAVKAILGDSSLGVKMGRAGRVLVEEEFSPSIVVKRMQQVYEACLPPSFSG